MLKTLVYLMVFSTACGLRNMRPRDETANFLDMFDAAVEEREAGVRSPEALVEQSPDAYGGSTDADMGAYGYSYYYPYSNPADAPQQGGSSPYYYDWGNDYYYGEGDDNHYIDPGTYPGIVDQEWARPWNIVNGACSENNLGKKHVMEITSVGGGSYYLGVIDIGTPKQPLNMILDTGSDEIVIKSSNCKGCYGYGYDFNASSTAVNDEQGPNTGLSAFAYGSGPVVVQRVNDTVHLGDFQGDGMGIQMIVDTTISFFQQDDKTALHAIVGMAPGMQEYVGNTLASNMEVRTFSECLPRNAEENGFFVVNDDRADMKELQGFEGPFRSVGQYYWAAGATGLRLDWEGRKHPYGEKDKIELYDENEKIVAIVDTGTSLLSMPQSVMDGLQQALMELNFDCARMKDLPKLKFEIQGVTHELSPQDYVAISDGSMDWHKNAKQNANKDGKRSKMMKDTFDEINVMKKMFFHKPGKPKFIDRQTGHECMLLFTDPLGQTSAEGEMAILGMPFFRQYEISFDFCTKEMYTKRSYGDCSSKVGQHPSNVQWCTDKDWFACWVEGFTKFFTNFWDGLVKIFVPQRGELVDENEQVAQKANERKRRRHGANKKHKNAKSAHISSIKPPTLRLSAAAQMLLKADKQGAMLSI
eukprot:gnl/MRDRNA2_/MRDRNA2_58867_c0_seq1.p1 gnl/MRDRNA2_/MRDRNA2_58867_c0~~gnl/MRDRNA2_/MRDRNA2_58867_c0_seq1.p1  ORF type:complete len:643 (+),score=136.79 gnl/MRDRNA2_/MRDRNA2_58867_c0_seq1:102-2030(+)